MTSLQLSQSALAALDRCERRFYLRFVRRLEWPAPLTGSEQEWEDSMRRGERLHLLIQQQSLGLPADALAGAEDAELQRWWRAYREQPPPQPEGRAYAELEVSVPFAGHHLVARFDRLVVTAGDDGPGLHIVDWKTGIPQEPERLERSWQTTVYRFVAVEAAASLTHGGQSVPPSRVTFVYWQAAAPAAAPLLTYDEAAFDGDRRRLAAAVERIDTRLAEGEVGFARTPDVEACRRCPFRSYCERGREAPSGLDVDEDLLAEAEAQWGGEDAATDVL